MALPASGPLVLGLTGGGNSINGEFGYGNDLGAYRGVFYGKLGQEFEFPVSPNSIAMQLFYNAAKITSQAPYQPGSGPFTVPVYNQLIVTVRGGQGGAGGAPGYISAPCSGAGNFTPGNPGSTGNISSFGGYISAAGGAGGPSNTAGSEGQLITQVFTNPVQGGSGPPSGSILNITVGSGGAGGSGGCLVYQAIVNGVNLGCSCWARASSGAAGGPGYVVVAWS